MTCPESQDLKLNRRPRKCILGFKDLVIVASELLHRSNDRQTKAHPRRWFHVTVTLLNWRTNIAQEINTLNQFIDPSEISLGTLNKEP